MANENYKVIRRDTAINSNGSFKTQDIQLAVFLKTRNIKLLHTMPIAPFRSEFSFEPVSQELLNEWLTSEASAPVRTTINEYRHLIRTARQGEMGVRDG